jgi:uncharacterized repeat protein (TIGR02543 family)
MMGFQDSSRDSVEKGTSAVALKSAVLSNADSITGSIPSGVAITATLTIINPKNLAVNYTLACDLAASSFSVAPPTTLTATTATSASFSFTLTTAAEHQSFHFTLGKTVPSTGRVYADDVFTVRCDSPPNAVANLTGGQDATTHDAFIAFTLPTAATDDDLAHLVLTYQDTTSNTPATTLTVPVNAASLLTASNPDVLSSVSSSVKRYFKPSVNAGHSYTFQVTVADTAGQKSSVQSLGTGSIQYTLAYNLNGGTGSGIPASASYVYGTSLTVTSSTPTLSGYTFGGWNTQSNGSGTAYASGGPIVMNFGNVILYAQWNLISYTVTFSGNGATGAPTAITQGSGTAVTLPDVGSMTNGTQIFDGWNTNSGGTGTAYNAGDAYTLTTNATLYATWLSATPTTLPLAATVAVPSGVTNLTVTSGTNNIFSTTSIITGTLPTTVVLPSTLTTLGYLAFHDCHGLTSITIPSSVTSLGYGVFLNDANVAVTMTSATPPNIASGPFDTAGTTNLKIYVPNAYLSTYQTAANWSAYAAQMIGY